MRWQQAAAQREAIMPQDFINVPVHVDDYDAVIETLANRRRHADAEAPGLRGWTEADLRRFHASVKGKVIERIIRQVARAAPEARHTSEILRPLRISRPGDPNTTVTHSQFKAALSGLSKRVKHFPARSWPMAVQWDADAGEAVYTMDPELATWWLADEVAPAA
jgi:hypothetical protein